MMEGRKRSIELISKRNVTQLFNVNLCIICQKDTKKSLTSTDNGRCNVIEAASIREDDVNERLKLVEQDFYYHVSNDCYVWYTRKRDLDKLKAAKKDANEGIVTSSSVAQQVGSPDGPSEKKLR